MRKFTVIWSLGLLLLFCQGAIARPAVPLTSKCLAAGRLQSAGEAGKATPVPSKCAAAAIAEGAFLEETQHKVTAYKIYAMRHTDARWYFMILIGDEKSPPAPGGHYMVAVDRATGKVELTPGA
jgi:hypothetical protein